MLREKLCSGILFVLVKDLRYARRQRHLFTLGFVVVVFEQLAESIYANSIYKTLVFFFGENVVFVI